MRNKKGIGMILAFGILLITFLIVLLIVLFVSSIVRLGFNEISPIINDLGNISITDTPINLTEKANYVFTPAQTIVNTTKWLVPLFYIGGLIFSIVIFGFYSSERRYLLFFYLAFMIFLIVLSAFISNTYQDFLSQENTLDLKEQSLSNYLILYSPYILAVIGLITGIFMFTKDTGEDLP
ncbi:MAG: hypothetical protein KatS3mg096_711 [Candidatus Parcubacteria bacterium]|nr:MAG: hypothetical protein KatS3mg096_711 [Candidatus Parcubacteria bacterium]